MAMLRMIAGGTTLIAAVILHQAVQAETAEQPRKTKNSVYIQFSVEMFQLQSVAVNSARPAAMPMNVQVLLGFLVFHGDPSGRLPSIVAPTMVTR
jgi:hypothetical protein